jgi:hypothetical protein
MLYAACPLNPWIYNPYIYADVETVLYIGWNGLQLCWKLCALWWPSLGISHWITDLLMFFKVHRIKNFDLLKYLPIEEKNWHILLWILSGWIKNCNPYPLFIFIYTNINSIYLSSSHQSNIWFTFAAIDKSMILLSYFLYVYSLWDPFINNTTPESNYNYLNQSDGRDLLS